MIGKLEGTISHKDGRFLIVNVGGVGYKVFVGLDTLQSAVPEEKISLWTYLAVRENALDLYGFIDKESLNFFEMLIDIPGIGPKSAMSILSVAGLETLKSAVTSNDHAYLTKLSGIGKRTAEKIVLELKDKLGAGPEGAGTTLKDESDAIDALKSLGYREREAREALKKVPREISGTSQKVKEALKILGQ
jgi:Holliday junction DNA helicase RuvA